ncbi:MAG: hypothetical protein JO187_02320 [Acidobacteria bacterium]|nr:hypothetical protein [Acidobacteriota bacterium]
MAVGKNPFAQGQVTIDTNANNGQGNLQLTNVGAMQNMELQFCSFPNGDTNCMNIAPVTTDASGNANMNFTFPQKGAFAGIFQLTLNGEQFAASGTGSSGTSFRAALLPAGTITGGINQATGHAQGIGAVSVNGTTAHVTLTGTTPNHTFHTALCSQAFSTPCTTLADVTTDAQGNASVDVGSVQPAGWSTFQLSDTDGVEFVSGFRVQ